MSRPHFPLDEEADAVGTLHRLLRDPEVSLHGGESEHLVQLELTELGGAGKDVPEGIGILSDAGPQPCQELLVMRVLSEG
jgi:hypothetical protein